MPRSSPDVLGQCWGETLPNPEGVKRRFVIELESKVLYELLKRPLRLEKVKKFVEHCNRCKSAFLRGFFDSEGSVDEDGEVTVYNTDLALLRYVKQLLSSLGIKTTVPHLYVKSGMILRDPRTGKHTRERRMYMGYMLLLTLGRCSTIA
ncbi:MAG: LAGLIDADG family homing endonuclease [Nitrososphaerota archaeon]